MRVSTLRRSPSLMVTKASVSLLLRSMMGRSLACNTRILTTHGMAGEREKRGEDGKGGRRKSLGRRCEGGRRVRWRSWWSHVGCTSARGSRRSVTPREDICRGGEQSVQSECITSGDAMIVKCGSHRVARTRCSSTPSSNGVGPVGYRGHSSRDRSPGVADQRPLTTGVRYAPLAPFADLLASFPPYRRQHNQRATLQRSSPPSPLPLYDYHPPRQRAPSPHCFTRYCSALSPPLLRGFCTCTLCTVHSAHDRLHPLLLCHPDLDGEQKKMRAAL